MNYYEHHIRDYDAATSHLSWDEDLAYTRLIRWYYRKEKPIPADIKEACRQVRAITKAQRDAVASVLSEFFVLGEDGWHNVTCDEAIARYKDGEPEREAKKANEENRVKRHREERARLFKQLTDAGQHAPWNIKIEELRVLVSGLPKSTTVTQPVTAPVTPATATQSPITNHQSPTVKPIPPTPAPVGADVGNPPKPERRKEHRASDDVKAVFAYWQEVMHHPQAKLDDKRSKAIGKRLSDGYTVEELCRAVDGCKLTPHNMGQNDTGSVYDDIELICRDSGHVDRFLKAAQRGPVMRPPAGGLNRQEQLEQANREVVARMMAAEGGSPQ